MTLSRLFSTTISTSFLLLFISACGGDSTQTQENVLSHKTDTINEAKKNVASMNTKVQTMQQTATQAPAPNASVLYTNQCSSCHGKQAEKSALNASENISKWDVKKIESALQGYKTGTFGGKMKAIMQAQIKPLSDEEIKLLSVYITKL